MKIMVRIKAHLAGTPTHDEDEKETFTLLILLNQADARIVPGTYFGQMVWLNDPYPLRYDIRQNANNTGFYFGCYSRDEKSGVEEVSRTNLHDRAVLKGEYFSVMSGESTAYTYIIDHVVDMNSLPS